ncbi:hypothetical protein FOA52_014712 [Chlamydomonas sp. UWO 241]|nr:hypothetical protein FOA52_014712 [Chlamydomonas sp. UWO 241]
MVPAGQVPFASNTLDAREAADGWEAFPDGVSTAATYKDDVKQRLAEQRQGNAASDLAKWPARHAADREILALEPPTWLPDSQATACGSCCLTFRAITRLKHHCRMCGKIFCHACCHKRLLLPPKFPTREPQRTCELCSSLLLPLQPFLAGTQSAAVQPPIHDSIDSVSLRSWLNSPWSTTLDGDIYKAANILHTFTRALRPSPEQALPPAVLSGARALVLLSSAKLSAGWSASVGTGVMVARDPTSGEWSAPCAVALLGMGWGLQFGGELADLMLVLRTEQQLRACCAGSQLGVGGNMGLAVGPVGRHADGTFMLGMSGASAPIFSYSCSKGAFVGVALEGSVMMVRSGVNEKFYGYSVSPQQLLLQPGLVPPPQAASTLYDALHVLVQKYEMRKPLTPEQLREQLAREKTEEAAAAATAAAAACGGSGGGGVHADGLAEPRGGQPLSDGDDDEGEDEGDDDDDESDNDSDGAPAAAAAAAAAAAPASAAAAAAASAGDGGSSSDDDSDGDEDEDDESGGTSIGGGAVAGSSRGGGAGPAAGASSGAAGRGLWHRGGDSSSDSDDGGGSSSCSADEVGEDDELAMPLGGGGGGGAGSDTDDDDDDDLDAAFGAPWPSFAPSAPLPAGVASAGGGGGATAAAAPPPSPPPPASAPSPFPAFILAPVAKSMSHPSGGSASGSGARAPQPAPPSGAPKLSPKLLGGDDDDMPMYGLLFDD